MQLSIASTSDFPAASAAYSSLVHGGKEGPQALELVFSPGTFSGQHLSLQDPYGRGQLTLTLRSSGPGPAVFTDCRLSLGGEQVRLEGLVFEGSHGQGCALRIQARDTMELDHVAFLDKVVLPQRQAGARVRSGLALLTAFGPAVRLTVRDSWLLGNRLPEGQALLALEAQAGQGFGAVLLDGVLVAGNANPLLSMAAPGDILVQDSLILLPPGIEGPALLPHAAARLRLEGGALRLDDDASGILDALRARARAGTAPGIEDLRSSQGI